MNNKTLDIIILLLVPIFIFPCVAADVNINISGKVVASPCTIDSSGVYSINLGDDIQAANLAIAGSYSSWKEFTVTLSNCPSGTTTVTSSFSGTPDRNDADMYANEVGSSYSSNIAINLQDATRALNVGNNSSMTTNVDQNRRASFPLRARVFSRQGGATVGNISSVVLLNMTYN